MLRYAMAVVLTLGLAACVTAPFGGGDDGTMSATIDGKAWKAGIDAPGAMAVTATRRELNGASHLTITGISTDGNTGDGITLGLRSRMGFPIGMYAVRSNGGDEAASASLQLDQDDYTGVSGKIMLDAIDDDSASGTFEFIADDSGQRATVTAGRFSASVREF